MPLYKILLLNLSLIYLAETMIAFVFIFAAKSVAIIFLLFSSKFTKALFLLWFVWKCLSIFAFLQNSQYLVTYHALWFTNKISEEIIFNPIILKHSASITNSVSLAETSHFCIFIFNNDLPSKLMTKFPW